MDDRLREILLGHIYRYDPLTPRAGSCNCGIDLQIPYFENWISHIEALEREALVGGEEKGDGR